MDSSPPNAWRRVHLAKLARVLWGCAPERRWRWQPVKQGERTVRLEIVSDRGVVWDFKLTGGAWIRKQTTEI